MNKKIFKGMSAAAIATIMASTLATPAFAAVDEILIQDKDNRLTQYNLKELQEDQLDQMMDGKGTLYTKYINELKQGKIHSYHDDKINAYVDAKKAEDAYLESIMDEKPIKIDDFTENATAEEIVKPEGTIYQITQKDGEITEIEKPVIDEAVKPAMEAVEAYEKAPITSNEEIADAEKLGQAATEKVNLVKDEKVKAELTAKIEAQNAKIAEAKKALNKVEVKEVSAINATSVKVEFSGEVKKASAENLDNYKADMGMTVTGAELQKDGKSVILTTSKQFALTNYTLTIANVEDAAGNKLESINKTFKGSDQPEIKLDYIAFDANNGGGAANVVNLANDDVLFSSNKDEANSIKASTTYGDADLLVQYNVDLDDASVNATNVQLKDANGNNVPVTVTRPSAKVINVNPGITLTNNQTYTLVVAGVKADKTTYTVPELTYTIKVGQSATTVEKTAEGATIAATATGKDLFVKYNQVIDAKSVTKDTVKLIALSKDEAGAYTVEGTAVEGTAAWDLANRKVTFTPATALTSEGHYKFVVDGVTNEVGIKAEKVSVNVTVDKVEKPGVYAILAEDGKDSAKNIDLTKLNTGAAIAETTGGDDFKVQFNANIDDSADAKKNIVITLYDVTDAKYVDAYVGTIDGYTPEGGKLLNKGQLGIGIGTQGHEATLEAGHTYKITVEGVVSANTNKTPADKVETTFTTYGYAPTINSVVYKGTADSTITTDKTVTNLEKDKALEITFSANVKDDAANLANVKLYKASEKNVPVELTFAADAAPGAISADAKKVTIGATNFNAEDTTWKLVIGKDFVDDAGHKLGKDVVYYFTTENATVLATDDTKTDGNDKLYTSFVGNNAGADEEVLAADLGAAKIRVNSPIKVAFNDTLDPASVNADTVKLIKASTKEVVATTVSLNTGSTLNKAQVVTVTPNAALESNTVYTLVVSGVTDEVGNKLTADKTYTFTTEAGALAANINVKAGDIVKTDGKIVVTFNQEPTAKNQTIVSLAKKDVATATTYSVDVPVAAKDVTWNSATNQLTIDLAKVGVANSEELELTVKATESGLAKDQKVTFSTEVDTVKPTVKSIKQGTTDLTKVTTGLGIDKDIVITFNDTDLDCGNNKADITIFNKTENKYVKEVGSKINVTEGTPDSVTITLSGDAGNNLKADNNYVITITGVKDTKKGLSETQNVADTITLNLTTGPVAKLGIAADANLGASQAFPDLTAGTKVVTTEKKGAIDVEGVVIPVLLTAGGSGTDEIDTTTVNENTVYVKDANGNKVNATIDFVGLNHQPVITVADKLAYNTTYTVVIDGVKEVSGNVIEKATFDFTTKKDTEKINFTKLYDSDKTGEIKNEGTVATGKTAKILFDTDSAVDLDLASLTKANIKLENVTDGKQVVLLDGMFSAVNKDAADSKKDAVEITLPAKLEVGKMYKLTVSGLTADDGALSLDGTATITFVVVE